MTDHSSPPTAHVDKLPADLMRNIFLMTIPGVAEKHPEDLDVGTWLVVRLYSNHLRQNTLLPPLRISHVSRHWRDLALSFGELWSYLSIVMHNGHEKKIRKIIEVFDTFLQRTNGCALRFHFCSMLHGRLQNPKATDTTEYILTKLLKEQRRWKDVILDLLCVEVSSSFPGIRITDTPILSALTFHTRGLTSYEDEQLIRVHINLGQPSLLRWLDLKGHIEFDCSASLLRALEECKFYFDKEFSDCPLPRSCSKLLKSSPSLRHFILDLYPDAGLPSAPDPGSEDPVIERDLEILKLMAVRSSESILNKLRLPRLKSLVYACNTKSAVREIANMVKRSRPLLTLLHIRELQDGGIELLDALRLLPTLTTLIFTKSDVPPFLIENLAVAKEAGLPHALSRADSSIICPQLSVLKLRRIRNAERSAIIDAVCSFIETRREAFDAFRDVCLTSYPSVLNPSLDRIRDILECMLTVHTHVTFCNEA